MIHFFLAGKDAFDQAEDNGGVSELLPDRTSDERDERDDERDERQRDRELEEERPPHHEPR